MAVLAILVPVGRLMTATLFPTGHIYGDWKVTEQPTTSSTGSKECVCTVCKDVKTDTIPLLDAETGEFYESQIDQRIEVTKNGDGAVRYYFYPVSVIDTRTWGDAPTIKINAAGGFDITYFTEDGTKVETKLAPLDGYIHRCVILEDGSYVFARIGDYKD